MNSQIKERFLNIARMVIANGHHDKPGYEQMLYVWAYRYVRGNLGHYNPQEDSEIELLRQEVLYEELAGKIGRDLTWAVFDTWHHAG